MLQIHTCLSVHCDECGDALGSPEFQAHYRTEHDALRAAAANRWRTGSGSRLLCSACAPILTCEAEGHQFNPWRQPSLTAATEYRYCRRCCELESRPATGEDRGSGDQPR